MTNPFEKIKSFEETFEFDETLGQDEVAGGDNSQQRNQNDDDSRSKQEKLKMVLENIRAWRDIFPDIIKRAEDTFRQIKNQRQENPSASIDELFIILKGDVFNLEKTIRNLENQKRFLEINGATSQMTKEAKQEIGEAKSIYEELDAKTRPLIMEITKENIEKLKGETLEKLDLLDALIKREYFDEIEFNRLSQEVLEMIRKTTKEQDEGLPTKERITKVMIGPLYERLRKATNIGLERTKKEKILTR